MIAIGPFLKLNEIELVCCMVQIEAPEFMKLVNAYNREFVYYLGALSLIIIGIMIYLGVCDGES